MQNFLEPHPYQLQKLKTMQRQFHGLPSIILFFNKPAGKQSHSILIGGGNQLRFDRSRYNNNRSDVLCYFYFCVKDYTHLHCLYVLILLWFHQFELVSPDLLLENRPVTFYYCFILGAFDHITWSQRSLNLLVLVHVSFFQSIYHLYKRLKSCQTSRVMRFCIIQKMYFHCAVVFSHFASPTLRLFSGKMLSTLKSTKLKFSTSQNKFVHEHKRSL